MMKIRILVLIIANAYSMHSYAGGGLTGGATEVTQLANNLQLVMSYSEQVDQTLTQINQYKTMLQNLKQGNPSMLLDRNVRKLWADAKMDDAFRDLYRITINGERTAYSLQSMNAQFEQLHPGYGNFKGQSFNNAYRNWSDTTRGALTSTLRMSAMSADDLQSEGDMIKELSNKSSTAEGQMQALQAGNQIGVSMVSQLQKLRQIQMAQIQAQNTTALAEQGRRDSGDEMMKKYYGFDATPTVRTDAQIEAELKKKYPNRH